jgi:hypothetical protein
MALCDDNVTRKKVTALFSKRIQLELNRVSQRVKSLDTFLWKKNHPRGFRLLFSSIT